MGPRAGCLGIVICMHSRVVCMSCECSNQKGLCWHNNQAENLRKPNLLRGGSRGGGGWMVWDPPIPPPGGAELLKGALPPNPPPK